MHTFKIKVGAIPGRDTVIEMDGKPLDGVTSVYFSLSANRVTTLHLEIMSEVLVEGEFEKHLISVRKPSRSVA